MNEKVSLFVPVYDVGRILKASLQRLYEALKELDERFEIIVVDDNYTPRSDRFKRLLERAQRATGREIRYLAYTNGPSRRENLAKSFAQARYEVIGFIDADLPCDSSYLLKAIATMKEKEADIVIGSRLIAGGRAERSLARQVISICYNGLIRIVFQSKIRDHQCGLKVFLKKKAQPLLDEMGYDHAFNRGWFWDAEFLIRAQRGGLRIVEMPVNWISQEPSSFDFRRELRCLKAIWKLFWELPREGKVERAPRQPV